MNETFYFAALPPLSLYIHLPWCVRKCPYCDFNSHAMRTTIPEHQYIDALLVDLQQELPRIWGRVIQSVFLGGGTPSLFTPEAIDRLLSQVRALLPLVPQAEITIEANPGTVDGERFLGFRQAGVNRLSIGIQSFQQDKLKALGRVHGREEALNAAEAATAAGFENVNLDLMFGLPNQTIEQAFVDVDTAIAMNPSHISLYQLTIEPNTQFYSHPPLLPNEDALWEMQEQCQSRLAASGFTQYEVSAYAKSGSECRHNLNYWRFGDYLGLGAGSHGKITDRNGITRGWKQKHPQAYMDQASVGGGSRRLMPREIPLEFMMNALRLRHGFPEGLFQERTGLPIAIAEKPLRLATDKGLLVRNDDGVQATETGRRLLNQILMEFI